MASSPAPMRPAHVDEPARLVLEALASRGLGHRISIGGAFGLLHYLDYRHTHDLDAWWSPDASPAEREEVLAVVSEVLAATGDVRVRRWGDVVSVEVRTVGRKFSVQIAERTARLEPSTGTGWVDVDLDAFPDLIASKMTALVERGAPRDFRDVHAVCRAGLVSARDCWRWWRERERRSGREPDAERARLAIETHLARIAQHRPLATITDPEAREEAATVRRWFEGFVDERVD